MINLRKKASSQMWWIIIVAIIALVMSVLILTWFKSAGELAFDDVKGRLNNLGDCDKDTVSNMFDKCPCLSGDVNSELSGCPQGTIEKIDCNKLELESCKKTSKK